MWGGQCEGLRKFSGLDSRGVYSIPNGVRHGGGPSFRVDRVGNFFAMLRTGSRRSGKGRAQPEGPRSWLWGCGRALLGGGWEANIAASGSAMVCVRGKCPCGFSRSCSWGFVGWVLTVQLDGNCRSPSLRVLAVKWETPPPEFPTVDS